MCFSPAKVAFLASWDTRPLPLDLLVSRNRFMTCENPHLNMLCLIDLRYGLLDSPARARIVAGRGCSLLVPRMARTVQVRASAPERAE